MPNTPPRARPRTFRPTEPSCSKMLLAAPRTVRTHLVPQRSPRPTAECSRAATPPTRPTVQGLLGRAHVAPPDNEHVRPEVPSQGIRTGLGECDCHVARGNEA